MKEFNPNKASLRTFYRKIDEFWQNKSLILSKTLDIYKIYLKLGIFLIYGGK